MRIGFNHHFHTLSSILLIKNAKIPTMETRNTIKNRGNKLKKKKNTATYKENTRFIRTLVCLLPAQSHRKKHRFSLCLSIKYSVQLVICILFAINKNLFKLTRNIKESTRREKKPTEKKKKNEINETVECLGFLVITSDQVCRKSRNYDALH